MLIYNLTVYTASVGTSRAMLSSTNRYPEIFGNAQSTNIDISVKLKNSRENIKFQNVECLQLTKDQVPEDPDELIRITQSEGMVKKFVNDEGIKMGPFRIWEEGKSGPGLAMSRSIGDSLYKHLGIISTPLISSKKIDKKSDLSIILASDGVWSVMENWEVANFVEYCRGAASAEIEKGRQGNVNIANSCVAQLLCEESRFRWLKVVEQDDVVIDDIACIVVELPKMILERINYINPPGRKAQGEVIEINEINQAMNGQNPRRGSVLNENSR